MLKRVERSGVVGAKREVGGAGRGLGVLMGG